MASLQSQGLWNGVLVALQNISYLVHQASVNNSNMGIAITVSYRNETIYQSGVGAAKYIDGDSQKGMLPDFDSTVWRIGSLTKVFTALMLIHQVDSNRVSYDTALNELMPEFSPASASAEVIRSVTLGSLASQISAVVREAPPPCLADSSSCNFTTSEVLPFVNELALLWAPGIRPAYSNLGISLLGRALETDEESYENYVESKILRPLGMMKSGFTWTDDVYSNLAVGSQPDHPVTHLGWTAPNGEMFATAHDMAQFLNFATSTESHEGVLSKWRKNEWLFKVGAILPDGVSGFGLPWEILYKDGHWLRTKAGNIDQFGSQLALDPTMNVAFWLAANLGDSQAAELAALVSSVLFPAFSSAIGNIDQGPKPARANEMVGSYFAYVNSVSADMTITVTQGPGLLQCVFEWGETVFPALLLTNDSVDDTTVILEISKDVPLPCITVTELAWNGEVMMFNFNEGTMAMPGLLSPIFTRQ